MIMPPEEEDNFIADLLHSSPEYFDSLLLKRERKHKVDLSSLKFNYLE